MLLYRKASNKHDNEYHEKATDSMVNYETVKYFTAEMFETVRFKAAVTEFQKYSVSTQGSLSLLNIFQAFVINGTSLACLIVSGYSVIKGHMEVGGFVAVNAYVFAIFAPLGFLGSVYGAIVQGLIDVQNLLQLLNEDADIKDGENAPVLPILTEYYGGQKDPNNMDSQDSKPQPL